MTREGGRLETIDDAALHAALFTNALDGHVVVDRRGVIVAANRAIEELVGIPRERLVGSSVETIIPERTHGHAARRAEYWTHLTPRVMGRGVALYVRHADGREIPVDISLNAVEVDGRTYVAAAIRDLRGRSYAPDTIRVQATALHAAANGVVITDPKGVIAWVNPAACRITGYTAAELVGQHTRILKSGLHAPEFYAELWQTIGRGETWSGTISNRRKDGTVYHEEQTIAPVVDDRGAVTHFVAIKQDVTRQHELQEAVSAANAALAASLSEIANLTRQLREEAIRDPLTDLHNRRFFLETAPGQLARAVREQQPFSVAVLDLDRFKEVNDRHGHHGGDAVLQTFAAVLRRSTRASDIVCRVGGEEFVVAMPGATVEVATERTESWRGDFEAAVSSISNGDAIPCTVSAGVAQHQPGETLEETIARADRALYGAKRAGRNRVLVAD